VYAHKGVPGVRIPLSPPVLRYREKGIGRSQNFF
jgi:hypothetical protein